MGLFQILFMQSSSLSFPFCEDATFSFQCIFFCYYTKEGVHRVFRYMSGLFTWFHWSVCLFLCQWYSVFIIIALLYNDIRDDYTYSNYFSIQDCLSHPRHFMIHMKLVIFHKLMAMPHCWAWRSNADAYKDASLLHISTFSTGSGLCTNKAQQTATQSQTL